ncbi:MAG: three-Cys-motif partner protein TcmP [Blastocatellia bacterium]
MANNTFFDIQKEQSLIKTAIVTEYFDAWANIMMKVQDRNKLAPEGRIAYMDLFAGPGYYKNGDKSTPIIVLEKAINNYNLSRRLVTFFNEKDKESFDSLKTAIEKLPNITRLKHKPDILNIEVGEDIIRVFRKLNLIPSLFFIDPWGYKGLSLELIKTVLKDWGCDCIFFFNYNRINMGLKNERVEDHMDALFGETRAKLLREKLKNVVASEQELTIVEEMCQAIKDMGKRFILPFRFRDEKGTRTSHHLIFVSKEFLGYDKMKQIMAKYSSNSTQGVASFEYNPANKNQLFLFQFSQPLEELENSLLEKFSGKTISFKDLYQQHSVSTPYREPDYRTVLKGMEKKEKITVNRPANSRKGTFKEDYKITFLSNPELLF